MLTLYSDEAVFKVPSRIPPETSRRFRLWGDPATLAIGDRVALTITTAPGNYGILGRTLGWTAADPLAGNTFTASGKAMLIAHNQDSVERTVTVTSVADSTTGREMTQVATIAPGDIAVIGSLVPNVWGQDDGSIWVDATSSNVRLAVIAPA